MRILVVYTSAFDKCIDSTLPNTPPRSYSDLPSFASARVPCSAHSSFVTQNDSRSFMISARTAPPKKTLNSTCQQGHPCPRISIRWLTYVSA